MIESEKAGAGAPPGGGGDRLPASFAWLWTAETVSTLGTTITTVALPALAVLRLDAGPAEVGLLVAASRLPFPVFGLVAGVVADRLPRRTVMIVCDLARVLLFGAIPALDAAGRTSIGLLVGIGVLSGLFACFFDICNLAYVPSLVGRQGIVRAYARLEIGFAVGSVAGPSLGGLLVQGFGAARAVIADSLSYLLSALCLVALRSATAGPQPEQRPPTTAMAEIREGIGFVLGERLLRSLLLAQGVLVLGAHWIEAPLVLFAYRDLHLSPGTFGAVLSVSGVGAVTAALVANRLGRGPAGRRLALLSAVTAICIIALPLAAIGPALLVLTVLLTLDTGAGTLANVIQVSLRQSRTPERLHGRMNALFRVVYWSALPLANLAGGACAAVIGARASIVVGGAICILAAILAAVTPLRSARLP